MRIFLFCMTGLSIADQPIMNMMPRWDDGFGLQGFYEYRWESELLDGDDEVGDGLTESVNLFHLEGVYTWDRSVRITAKLPFILDAQREVLDDAGNVVKERDSGVGDLTLALPLKRYFNEEHKSGSWTAAPLLRVPLSEKDTYDIYNRAWGGGIFLGYEQETPWVFFSTGLSAWFYEGEEPEKISGNLDIGWNFNGRGQLLWETDFHYESDDSKTLSTGPALYFRFSDLVHSRLAWKFDAYDYQGVIDHGNGHQIRAGVGFVW